MRRFFRRQILDQLFGLGLASSMRWHLFGLKVVKAMVVEKKSKRKVTGMAKRSTTSKRELIDTGKDKRYVRRNPRGQFKEVDDVGRSLSADRRTKAKTKVPAGQGDRGDQKRKL